MYQGSMGFGEKNPSSTSSESDLNVGLRKRADMKDIPQDLQWRDMFADTQKKFPEIKNKLAQEKIMLKVSPQQVVQTNLAEIIKGLVAYTDRKNGQITYLPGKGPVWRVDNMIGKDPQGNKLENDRLGLGELNINHIQTALQRILPEAEITVDSQYNSSTELGIMLAAAALGVPNVQFEGRKQSGSIVIDNQKYRYRLIGWKRNGEARTIEEVPPKKTEKIVDPTPVVSEKTKEKIETLQVNDKWLHEEALIRDCTLAPEKIAALHKGFDSGKPVNCNITASVDHRQVAERSWDKIDKAYEEAKIFMLGAKGEKTLFLPLWNELLAKAGKFKQLQAAGGPERNKELLIARAVAAIKELFNNAMVPYLRNKRNREKLTDEQVIAERTRLISMIKIDDLKVGGKTSKDMQQDRYTSLQA